jgi:hypothetical protein
MVYSPLETVRKSPRASHSPHHQFCRRQVDEHLAGGEQALVVPKLIYLFLSIHESVRLSRYKLRADPAEIEDVGWYSTDNPPLFPPKVSIKGRAMERKI